MPTPEYPLTLPGPSTFRLRPGQQLAESANNELGAVAARRRSRQPLAEADVTFRYLEADYDAFYLFWRTQLLQGHRWFMLPVPSGLGIVPHVVRFADRYSARNVGHRYVEVTAKLEIRERQIGNASAIVPLPFSDIVVRAVGNSLTSWAAPPASVRFNADPNKVYRITLTPDGEFMAWSGYPTDAGAIGAGNDPWIIWLAWRQFYDGSAVPLNSIVQLLLHMDGVNNGSVFTDNSASPKTVTAFGGAVTSNERVRFGNASFLGGAGRGLSIPFSAGLSLQSTNFALEGEAFLTGTSGFSTVVDFRGSSAFTTSWGLFVNNNNRSLNVYDGPSTSTLLFTGINSVPLNEWFSWGVIREDDLTTLTINGQPRASAVYNPPPTHSSGIRIGINQATQDWFQGNLDEIRLTAGNSRYTLPYNRPNSPFPNANNIVEDVTVTANNVGALTPALAAARWTPLQLTGFDRYDFYLVDPNPGDNRGGLSLRITTIN